MTLWNTPFSRPSSSFEQPVPTPGVDPGVGPLVCVSFNEKWLPYVVGSLKQLLLNTTFDVPQGSDEFNTVQQQAGNLINRFVAAKRCTPEPATAEVDEMPRLRIDPDNCMIIQIECQPDQWEQFYPPVGCANPSASQPPPANANPEPGQTFTECFTLQGSGKLLLPVTVSAGDTITVHDAKGGWTDGTPSWFCPDGQNYIVGGCAGGCTHAGGDPSATACHMSIIALINGVYYPTSAPIVVPPGVTDQQVVFQANDGSLSDNSGSVQFCVDVKNNAAPTWHHVFDFLANDGGWLDESCTPYFGNWVPGTGWTEGAVQNLGIIKFAPVGTSITRVRIVTTGVSAFNAKLYTTAYPGCGGANTLYIDHAPGDFTVDVAIIVTSGQPALNFHQDAVSAGDAVLARLELWGTGSDPF